MAVERGQRHIAVDPLSLLLVGIFGKIVVEDRRVVVQVKRQLGIVEMRVFLDVRVERPFRGGLECVERGDLVTSLDVAVGQIVVRYLPDRVGPVPHQRVVLDGSLVVLGGVEKRAGVEIIVAVHIVIPAPGHIVIFLGLGGVALGQVGLGDYPREMPLTLLRRVLIHLDTIFQDV